eukprot:TRINITY_DN71825_c0_g1_i1.p1 TRINITY_DN71825_c0_g1~~TRINITY_DN71825_c0_g1_i1.p1  ORF type:complete len:210 (+),score=35.70 TRINITY_DN71825_c0_g1_i1:62-691(+)
MTTAFVAGLCLIFVVYAQPVRPKFPDSLSSTFVQSAVEANESLPLTVGNIYYSREHQVIRVTATQFGLQYTAYDDYTSRISTVVEYDTKHCQHMPIPDGDEFPQEDALANATFAGAHFDQISNLTIYGWNVTQTNTIYGDEQGNIVLIDYSAQNLFLRTRYLNPANASPTQPDWFTPQCPVVLAMQEKLQAGWRRDIGLLSRLFILKSI